MPSYAILFGLLLSGLGVTAYVSPNTLGGGKPYQISALSPAFIGVPILLTGLVSLAAPGARKHAMHGAAVLGLLGTVGGLVPVILRKFDFEQTAVLVGLTMTVLSGLFLGLCVKSFIDAKKARKAAEAAAAA
ncbi:hypothetical protein [Frigoriglobus tundricola]|uniref:Uncharacterized protein n=1 Tax=Frigoriglobus tundricola TaxID=2774151 RepID=A0A6M5YHT9_9BACT|nr:hypothetical protein [Frigoriglobus tundricola]QJW93639.1 hypothetical protein FTUN_1147 [Frigoriglobus tundricola]